MTTLQYESLPQRPTRARRTKRQDTEGYVTGTVDAPEGGGGGSRGGKGGDESRATTTNAADRTPSSALSSGSKEGDKEASAAEAVTPRGPIEGARSKRCREEDGDEEAGGGRRGGGDASTTASTGFSRARAVPGFDFEYLDHTADIQIHSWGDSLEEAFASAGLGMLNYMTPLEGISTGEGRDERRYSASGHDLDTLLFSFLDEILFAFSTEGFVARELRIVSKGGRIDRGDFSLEAVGVGEKFDRERHASGTEVKAITYSAMRIVEHGEEKEDGARETDVWVIVDI